MTMPEEETKKRASFLDTAKSVLYGMAGHDMSRFAL